MFTTPDEILLMHAELSCVDLFDGNGHVKQIGNNNTFSSYKEM